MPWRGFSCSGTTDSDFYGDLDRVWAERDEVRYLLRETMWVFPGAKLEEVYVTTAGVRPLVRDPRAKREGQASRKHRILHHERLGNPGYFTVPGGKITNMRSVAEETVDMVVGWLGADAKPCSTRTESFPGAPAVSEKCLGGASKRSKRTWTSTVASRRRCPSNTCRNTARRHRVRSGGFRLG